MPPDKSILDKIVLLLVNGMSHDAAIAYCTAQGQSPGESASTVSEARKRITIAADFTRDEQIGRAVMRLEDLYAKSIAARDTRTALQAQRELNRLLGLYGGEPGTGTGNGVDATDGQRVIDLVTAYVLPLRLADPSYPLEEHCRIAAELIRANGLALK